MSPKLQSAFTLQMKIAKEHYQQQQWKECFYHLENAHVLGQQDVARHTLSHIWMLRVAWKKRNWKELAGQLFRASAALVITPFWVPLGNTGGANVSATQAMEIRPELREYFKH